jgi:phenylpyruvate tautomerase PptA (4-oxalocrotonate tautomerase family)
VPLIQISSYRGMTRDQKKEAFVKAITNEADENLKARPQQQVIVFVFVSCHKDKCNDDID